MKETSTAIFLVNNFFKDTFPFSYLLIINFRFYHFFSLYFPIHSKDNLKLEQSQ